MIKREEEWEIEKIMNKRKVQGKDKYLVQWKGCIAKKILGKARRI